MNCKNNFFVKMIVLCLTIQEQCQIQVEVDLVYT